MKQWNPERVVKLLLQAGQIGLDYQKELEITCKTDGTVVTQADIAIEEFLTQHLEATDDGVYIIGEETEKSKGEPYVRNALANTMYIVDPIDGTSPYSSRLPIWGVSLGYAVGGRLEHGAIYMPAFGEIFYTDGDDVYLIAAVDDGVLSEPRLLQRQYPEFNNTGIIAITQGAARQGTMHWPNPVHALCCAVMPLCYLLQGKYMAYIGDLKIWDMAGGFPMLLRHGFDATLQDGAPITNEISEQYYNLEPDSQRRWRLKHPCLFAPPGMAERILSQIE